MLILTAFSLNYVWIWLGENLRWSLFGLEGLNCVPSCVIEKMKERDLYHGLFRRLSSYYPIGALTGSKLRNRRCQT